MMRIASHATSVIVAGLLGGYGCGFSSGSTVLDGSTGDGPGGSDGSDGPCAWALHFDACTLPRPPASDLILTSGTWTFDTTGAGSLAPAPTSGTFDPRGTVAQTGGPDVLLIWVKSLAIQPGA